MCFYSAPKVLQIEPPCSVQIPLSHQHRPGRGLTLDLEDSLSQTTDVGAGDTRHGDTSILGRVHGVLLSQPVHLLGRHASVGEHADLRGDVAPVVLAAELLEVVLEEGAHGDDAVGHALDLAEPLLVEGRVAEDLGGDSGAVDGRVGDHGADDDLELGVDALDFLGVGTDEGEGTDTLTIETLFVAVSQ